MKLKRLDSCHDYDRRDDLESEGSQKEVESLKTCGIRIVVREKKRDYVGKIPKLRGGV